MNSIALLCESPHYSGKAESLSRLTSYPLFYDEVPEGFDFILAFTAERVELRDTEKNGPGPVFVEFGEGKLDYRRRFAKGQQLIHKAVGGGKPRILDGTAGLGGDAFV